MRKILSTLSLLLLSIPAIAEERLPTIDPNQYNDDQKKAAEAFMAARHVPVFGPFEPLMYSPDVMTNARSMGDYLRYHSVLGNVLSEFVILVTARQWSQDYEWYVHAPLALKAGIAPEKVEAIKLGKRPERMTDDEAMLYDFSMELHQTQHVSSQLFQRVEKRFGKRGIVDLTAISGYYVFLAMQLNVAEYPIPSDGNKLPSVAK
jgi:4-carboxymuconolactone decarboxylase